MKKKLSAILCIFLILSLVMPTQAAVKIQKPEFTTKTKMVYMVKDEKLSPTIKGNTKTIKWKTKNKAIVGVNKKGIWTAKKKGSTTLTGTYGKNTLPLKVIVLDPYLNYTDSTITVGHQFTLKLMAAAALKVKWVSSDKTVATVNQSGRVTGKKVGRAVIKATVAGVTYSHKIEVRSSGTIILTPSARYVIVNPTPTPSPVVPTVTPSPVRPTVTPTPVPDQGFHGSTYVLNTDTKKIHKPGCSYVDKIDPENYAMTDLTIAELQSMGYTTCGKEKW